MSDQPEPEVEVEIEEAVEGNTPDDKELEVDAPGEVEVIFTSDDALGFAEARRLTSTRGATVTLFAGDTDAGKTTATVEIWTTLLSDGRLGGGMIAGANNALAFERRSWNSRLESGENTTLRTDEESDGFLHLSVVHQRGRLEVLFADYSGEHYKAIREGVEVFEELPWFGRVDRLAVFIDGHLVAGTATAELAATRTRRLLWKFRDCAQRDPRVRVALVVSKAELINDQQLAAFRPTLDELHALARSLDPDAALLMISSRPASGTEPVGLDDLFDWICSEDRPAPPREPVLDRPRRAFGRFA